MNKVEKIGVLSYLGSVTAAVLASLCCIGPLVFVLLGISGAAFFAKFEHYRWVFGIIALGFLALGFFFTYKNTESCVTGSNCSVKPVGGKLNKILLWISAALVFGLIFSPNIIGFFLA